MKDIFIDFNVKFGLEKIWKWKLWIGGATLIAGAVTYLLSLQLPDEYKCTASFIPPHLNSLTMMVFDNQGEKYRGLVVGSEEDLDRTVEYLTSMAVVDSLAKRFDLYNHYKINMKNKNRDKLFYHTFDTKNKIGFSDNSVVTIQCYDEDSVLSYQIAQAFLGIAEGYFENITRRREGLAFIDHKLDSLRKELKYVQDSLSVMRDKDRIFVMNNEGDPVSQIMADNIRNNPNFRIKYDHLRAMEFKLNSVMYFIDGQEREQIIREDNINKLPRLSIIVQEPVMTNFKARPKRSIITAVAMASMLFFCVFIVLMVDRSKDKLPI